MIIYDKTLLSANKALQGGGVISDIQTPNTRNTLVFPILKLLIY